MNGVLLLGNLRNQNGDGCKGSPENCFSSLLASCVIHSFAVDFLCEGAGSTEGCGTKTEQTTDEFIFPRLRRPKPEKRAFSVIVISNIIAKGSETVFMFTCSCCVFIVKRFVFCRSC